MQPISRITLNSIVIGNKVMGSTQSSFPKRTGTIVGFNYNYGSLGEVVGVSITVDFDDCNDATILDETNVIFFPDNKFEYGIDFAGRTVCPECLHTIDEFVGIHQRRSFSYTWKRGNYICFSSEEQVKQLFCPDCNHKFTNGDEWANFDEQRVFSLGVKWGARIEYGEQVLELLYGLGFQPILTGRTVYLMAPFNALSKHGYTGNLMMYFDDNGGEINLGVVNGEGFESIPYMRHQRVISPETLVYRILQCLAVEPINYEMECSRSWLENYRASKPFFAFAYVV
ncbi:hypothetical protein POF51_29585 [Brevibacillus sp. AG]|uniref:hypothetical protein n=1 Tax=Brevibacillus sp. AG TaxID=3020891 RepID=UPI0023312DE8|nr:hypothetical protein [Brevibacillus sp. AG]MDC0764877.1 hypothetical protein [Brevibacillus sp. AG]